MRTIKWKSNWLSSSVLYTVVVAIVFLACSRSTQIYFFRAIPFLQMVYIHISRIVSVVVLGFFLCSFKKVPKALYVCLIAVYACLLLSTLINGGNFRRWLSATYPIMALSAFVVLQCSTMDRAKRFLNVLSGLMWVLTAVNLILMPFSGMLFGKTTLDGNIFLLGMENHLSYPLTVGLLLNLLNDHFNQHRARLQSYIIIYFVTAFINFSVGSLAGATVLLLYFLIPPVKRFYEKRPFVVFIGVFAVIFVALVFFSKPVLTFPPMRFIIEDVLGKDVTLTHRTKLWDLALQKIAEKPIFGYGVGDTDNVFSIYAWDTWQTWSAHNQYLQTWYTGGTLTLLAVIGFLLCSDFLLRRSTDKQLSGYIKVIATVFMVMLLVEASSFNMLFFALILGVTLTQTYRKEQTALQQRVEHSPQAQECISVVVPIYNVETYLEECIESILNQSYRELEIILVNDGPTDSSYEICKRFAARDDRIVLLSQENAGLSAARNTGIQAATGKYITFIDSDDAIDPDMIGYLHTLLTQHEADVSVCQKEFTDEQSAVLPHGKTYADTVLDGNTACMNAFFRDVGLDTCAWGKLYKTAMFETIEYPVGKYHEDVFTTYRLVALCDRIAVGNRRLYQYRQRAGSIIQSAFSPKHLHAVEGSIQRAEFVCARYPQAAKLAKASIVYTANSCAMRLTRCTSADAETVAYLQQQYRRYEWDFLRGNNRMAAKLFSVLAYIHLGTLINIIRSLKGLRGRSST